MFNRRNLIKLASLPESAPTLPLFNHVARYIQHLGVVNVAGVNNVTYDDPDPTGIEIWPVLADAAQQLATNRKKPMDLWVLHTRRWEWLTVELDSQGRPLINVNGGGGQNVIGEGGVARPGGGYTLKGVEALQDPNVPINLGAGENMDFLNRAGDLGLDELNVDGIELLAEFQGRG